MLSFLQLAACGVVAVVVWLVVARRSKKPSLDSYKLPDPPTDTVILHQFGPAPAVPSVSPFVIKLETYLRAAGIPYVNKFDRKLGPKGKIPWIQYNEHVMSDSQFCVEFLNQQFSVNLSRRLSPQEAALGQVVRRTAEEFIYWAIVWYRLCGDPSSTLYRQLGLPAPFIWYLRHESARRVAVHGIGRHSHDEVTKLTRDDLRALSVILGNKNFLFGNSKEEVTEVDCALFGQLCELLWGTPLCPVAAEAREKFPNLEQFCLKMKEAFWPDWEERLLGAKTKADAHKNGTAKSEEGKKSSPPLQHADSSIDDVTPIGPMSSDFTESEVLRSRAAKINGTNSS
ncbi:failed axon connections homolog [Aplysia californica]|uniref:Failed axon connections homolog n=1 Tax=Aplysia californica TaxID=6500 RepID=A0ABM0K5Y0_APLCA|nr:failed axon connections homolog [Aplysia californica]